MSTFFRRFTSLPARLIGAAAAVCFASSQVWAQSTARSTDRALPPVIDVTTASIAGAIRDMAIKGDSIEVTYVNNGTVPTVINGEVQLYVAEDDIRASVVFADALTVRAGATLRFRVAMPKLGRGKYTMIAIVDYGGVTMTAAKAALQMP
jgi:hypothetical protein